MPSASFTDGLAKLKPSGVGLPWLLDLSARYTDLKTDVAGLAHGQKKLFS